MSDDIAIKVENLTKIYKLYNSPTDRLKEALSPIRRKYHHDFHALSEVSFEVKKGESLGILGVNGSGKSTLLKILSGVLTPSGGSVSVNGKVSALLELGAGFNPELTGLENVYFNGTLMGYSKADIDDRLDNILKFADIGEFIYQPVKSYSSGMFVRLAFSVATIVDPDILIVDEALSVGDVFFQQKCYKRLEELRENNVTILFVTHGVGDVIQFCSRALLLHKGRLECVGAADKVARRYLQRQQDEHYKEVPRTIVAELDEPIFDSDPENFVWPDSQHFMDISGVETVSNGIASFTRVALCNENLMASKVFMQGEVAYLCFELELISPIDVPIGGFVVRNQKNVLIHGRSMMFYNNMKLPRSVREGRILRFTFGLELNLGVGEYTVDIGLSTSRWEDYENRKQYSLQQMPSISRRLCSLSSAAGFAVTQKPFHDGNFDHLHIGVCNMKTNCSMSVK